MKPRMQKPSRGAAAVVTGAGSGIGRSFAYEIARRGGAVVCVDIDEARARETASLLQGLATHAVPYVCDVGNAAQMAALAAEAEGLLGRPVTLLVNNAGVGVGGAIGEVSLEDWRWCVDVNLWGVVHGCHFFAPRLKALGYGGIINVASAAAFGAAPEMSAYNVTKAGVLALTETLAAEMSGTGIHVTALCPTFVKTNIVKDGRIEGGSADFAAKLIARTGVSPESVVLKTLDALDRNQLYVVPQLEAKAVWTAKRLSPAIYTRGAGLLNRFLLKKVAA